MDRIHELRDACFLSGQEAKNPDGADCLTEYRGKCGTSYSHSQNKDKNRIKDDIDHSTYDGGHHADLCKSLCSDKRIHTKYDQDKETSENINSCISCGIGHGHTACTEKF